MRALEQVAQQLKQVWLGMSAAGRVGFVVLTAVCLAAIAGVGYWASQPDFRVLYTGLSAEDAGAITARLQGQGITFRLAADGTSIMVPAAQVQQARIDLAVEGLPAGGAKGFEIMDESPLGSTPFMQHVNYNRAIQAELSRTIMQLEPVAFARVHIVQPDATPFIREQKPTTASVVLKLKPGRTLSRNAAAGIVALVSGAVEGLTPDAVTLLDTTGRVLSEPQGDSAGTLASSQLEYRREVETYLASKAEDMLAQVLGPAHAIVRVTADINFKRLKQTKEQYSPEDKVITKEMVVNKKSTTPAASRGGPAGTGSNLKPPPDPAAGNGPGMQEESIESEYVVSKSVQETDEPVGNVQRLTVAVMVDLPEAPADAKTPAIRSITLADAEEIVKQAVGFQTGRDAIKVSDVAMAAAVEPDGLDEQWQTAERWNNYEKLARHGSLAVAALGVLLLARMLLNRLLPARQAVPQPEARQPRLLDDLTSEAQERPELVAQLLSSWLENSEQRNKNAA